LTVRELARQLGVSASFVSQLENGKSQPSVATLYSLAQHLGVSLDEFFEGPPGGAAAESPARGGPGAAVPTAGHASMDAPTTPPRMSVTPAGERTRLVMDSGVIWEQLSRTKDDHVDFIEVCYPPGSSSTTDERMLRHDGYDYGYLLEGELQVTLGFEDFLLHAGEAIGFDSSIPHRFKNPGTTPARGIWFVHHPHG
jgi:quercetin dioxygenase-like cupin family protein/DNA-binding XRE family transcriptional regulator